MTLDEATQVLSVKHKLDGYYASQTMSLSLQPWAPQTVLTMLQPSA